MGDTEGEVVKVGRRVYVGNLAWRTSWQELKDKFRENGNVVYANVMTNDDGRSKGWGIVEFEHPEEALAAINAQNGVDLGGRRMLVREDREDRDVKAATGDEGAPRERPERGTRSGRTGGRGARTPGRGRGPRAERPERVENSSGLQIVVQGIPWSYTWKELKELFAEYGEVERADVVMGADGRSRGFGTVRFCATDAAQAAISAWHEQELEGRKLSVFCDKYA